MALHKLVEAGARSLPIAAAIIFQRKTTVVEEEHKRHVTRDSVKDGFNQHEEESTRRFKRETTTGSKLADGVKRGVQRVREVLQPPTHEQSEEFDKGLKEIVGDCEVVSARKECVRICLRLKNLARYRQLCKKKDSVLRLFCKVMELELDSYQATVELNVVLAFVDVHPRRDRTEKRLLGTISRKEAEARIAPHLGAEIRECHTVEDRLLLEIVMDPASFDGLQARHEAVCGEICRILEVDPRQYSLAVSKLSITHRDPHPCCFFAPRGVVLRLEHWHQLRLPFATELELVDFTDMKASPQVMDEIVKMMQGRERLRKLILDGAMTNGPSDENCRCMTRLLQVVPWESVEFLKIMNADRLLLLKLDFKERLTHLQEFAANFRDKSSCGMFVPLENKLELDGIMWRWKAPVEEKKEETRPISLIRRFAPESLKFDFTRAQLQKDVFHSNLFLEDVLVQEQLKDLKVAILDTGIDAFHPDLNAAIEEGKTFVQHEHWWIDENGHGTHCAGLICGRHTGVVPGVRLLVAKVLDRHGGGHLENIATAIGWAVDRGAKIISMSLGGPEYHEGMYQACLEATKKGVILVCAAGNAGALHRFNVTFPATVSCVLRVGSVGDLGHPSVFSSVGGPQIDVVAPGEDVLSTLPGAGYGRESGTSMATPLVAGLCALLIALARSKNCGDQLNNEHQVKALMRALCFNSTNAVAKGHGFPEVKALLQAEGLLAHVLREMLGL